MKKVFLLLLSIIFFSCTNEKEQVNKKLKITLLKNLPYSTTNNAVAEGFIDGKPYVFTFGDLNITKKYSGIQFQT